MGATTAGRTNQRLRTRKELLQAAARLLKQGKTPTLEDVAEEAMVSRATAYRYFQGVEAVLVEAPLDVAVPDAHDLFKDETADDPFSRLMKVDTTLQDIIAANEVSFRLMLARALEQKAKAPDGEELPVRQNRRTPLIEAALAPARSQFDPKALQVLKAALALIVGTEAMVVFRDVLRVSDAEASKVKRWAIHALIEAATRSKR